MRWNWKRYLTVPRGLCAAGWAFTLGLWLPLDWYSHPLLEPALLVVVLFFGFATLYVPLCDLVDLMDQADGRRGR